MVDGSPKKLFYTKVSSVWVPLIVDSHVDVMVLQPTEYFEQSCSQNSFFAPLGFEDSFSFAKNCSYEPALKRFVKKYCGPSAIQIPYCVTSHVFGL